MADITLGVVSLPASLQWKDELTSQSVAQTVKRTLDGSVVVFYGEKTNGIPITLESGNDHGWVRRSVVESLKALAEQAGSVYQLAIRNQTFNVMFDHAAPPAFTATPIIPFANPTDTDWYRVSLKLITI